MFEGKDPYERLIELERFAKAADQHIANLLRNQTHMVKAHNANTDKIDQLVKTVNELRFDVLKLETLIKEIRR